MEYYLYGKAYKSYVDVLRALKRVHGTVKNGWWEKKGEKPIPYQDFSELYSHNDNDGIYTPGRMERRTRSYWVRDEVTQAVERVDEYYHVWIEPTFTPKTLRVTDSYGRVLNSKDLWLDMQDVEPEAGRKYRYRGYSWMGTGTGRKNGWWRKYRGNHGGFTGELRDTIYHELEQDEIKEEYGTTYKIRRERRGAMPQFWWQWDSHRNRSRRTKGWKRTRKEKQWM